MSKLSLRLRIFLFFCLLALGGTILTLGALYAGHARALSSTPANGFVFAGILASFGLVALTTGVWLLFDENVAKPIERLSGQLRARAHAGAGLQVNTDAARYLGDLAPAASAITAAL